MKNKRVLVAPLDWGLGHATRCVPLIRELQTLGITPVIASSGTALTWLQQQFPELDAIALPGYNVRYSAILPMSLHMLRLAPSILNTIRKEQAATQHILKAHAIDGIISDHRYGVYSSNVPSVFVSHQLVPHAGKLSFLQRIIQNWHVPFLTKFQEVWIPDEPAPNDLSGTLSQHAHLTMPVHYLGWLSAHTTQPATVREGISFILSGVEPHRTQLEHQFMELSKQLHVPIRLVRGTPIQGANAVPPHVHVTDIGSSLHIAHILQTSALVVSRCGYSSLMDAQIHRVPAIFIPTPGQTEQEYLAQYNRGRTPFLFVKQRHLTVAHLQYALENAGTPLPYQNQRMATVLTQWATRL